MSDARKRDHGSVSSATTVSAYEQACARQLWKVPDRGSIAAHTFASSYIAGRVWALNGKQEI